MKELLKTIYSAHGLDGIIEILSKLRAYTGTFLGNCLRACIVDEAYLEMRCAKGDAAETALYYGEVCSAVFPLAGALVDKYHIYKYDINIYPDFLARSCNTNFSVRLHIVPLRYIGFVLAYGLKLIFGIAIGFLVKLFSANKNKTQKIENKENTKKKEA